MQGFSQRDRINIPLSKNIKLFLAFFMNVRNLCDKIIIRVRGYLWHEFHNLPYLFFVMKMLFFCIVVG